jgi:hypothetical protein
LLIREMTARKAMHHNDRRALHHRRRIITFERAHRKVIGATAAYSNLVLMTIFQETKMKFALIGAAALVAAASATPALAQAAISDPGYCAQFYPNANCQNLGLGNRIPTAATIATPGRTATRSWSIIGTVTIGRTADSGSRRGRCPAARESAAGQRSAATNQPTAGRET